MRESDFVTTYRQTTTAWLSALEDLVSLKGQYDSLDLGNTLSEDAFTGVNEDITLADLVAAVGSVEAINALFVQGHATNLYKIKL